MKKLIIFAVLLLIGVSCSQSGQRKAIIVKTKERLYVKTTLYSAGDTIVVRYSPARDGFMLDTHWPQFKGDQLDTQYGRWYKAVIL